MKRTFRLEVYALGGKPEWGTERQTLAPYSGELLVKELRDRAHGGSGPFARPVVIRVL